MEELGKYGMIVKRNMKELYPMRYNELILDTTLMDKLIAREKEIVEQKEIIEKQIKAQTPPPQTNEFIVMAKYNQLIESMVEEQLQPMLTEKI